MPSKIPVGAGRRQTSRPSSTASSVPGGSKIPKPSMIPRVANVKAKIDEYVNSGVDPSFDYASEHWVPSCGEEDDINDNYDTFSMNPRLPDSIQDITAPPIIHVTVSDPRSRSSNRTGRVIDELEDQRVNKIMDEFIKGQEERDVEKEKLRAEYEEIVKRRQSLVRPPAIDLDYIIPDPRLYDNPRVLQVELQRRSLISEEQALQHLVDSEETHLHDNDGLPLERLDMEIREMCEGCGYLRGQLKELQERVGQIEIWGSVTVYLAVAVIGGALAMDNFQAFINSPFPDPEPAQMSWWAYIFGK